MESAQSLDDGQVAWVCGGSNERRRWEARHAHPLLVLTLILCLLQGLHLHRSSDKAAEDEKTVIERQSGHIGIAEVSIIHQEQRKVLGV
jgi:hypothetical protein